MSSLIGSSLIQSTETALTIVSVHCGMMLIRLLFLFIWLKCSCWQDRSQNPCSLSGAVRLRFSNNVLEWFRSYISTFGDQLSNSRNTSCGTARGSCLDQLLFSLCMLPLGNPMRQQSTNHRSYAADTCYMLDDNSLIALFPTDINKWTSTF